MNRLAKMMAVTGCACLLSGCVTPAGYHVIEGVVSDVDSKPVPGAIVTTVPTTSSVSTDNEGRYIIKSLKQGEYTLKASKLGYVSQPTKVRVRGTEFIQGDIQIIPEELVPMPTPVYVESAPAPAEVPPAVPPAESQGEEAPPAKPAEEDEGTSWWESE